MRCYLTVRRQSAYCGPMRQTSTLKRMVDDRLEARGLSFASFVENGRRSGKTTEELWADLRDITGVPVAVRTMYRWVENMEQVA